MAKAENKTQINDLIEANRLLVEKNERLQVANQKLTEHLQAQKERFSSHLEKDTMHETLQQELMHFKAEATNIAEQLHDERSVCKSVIDGISLRLSELESQRYEMAEANLRLLEITEIMENQKIALGEANLELLEVTEALQEEKHKTEKLLRNILPVRVAEELKATGKSVPESFEDVSVFFSDIVGFTKISSKLSPHVVIEELSDIFTNFDHIFHNNHCERIKTIGDAYLSVCGMPDADESHAKNILNAALEVKEYLIERNKSHSLKWTMRMGVHSGQVVGGIVGIEKYIYDIFGDTINTASRMERYSEPMCINVSENTCGKTREYFNFSSRPPIEVKGKGKINMYFLENQLDQDK